MHTQTRNWWRGLALTLCGGIVAVGSAQVILEENFNNVTETGGGPVLIGSGFNEVNNWDDGISGENAFGGTVGNAFVNPIAAFGDLTGGVGGTGAGIISVDVASFNLLDINFNAVTGTGGGEFLAGVPGLPDTFNFTTNWDDGITGEGAFGGTFGGAILLGNMSAQGIPSGGSDNLGGGQIDVNNVDVTTGGWYAGLQWDVGALPGAVPLLNPSFDDGLNNWNPFGNAYSVNDAALAPLDGGFLLKMFGNFTGGPNTVGVFQDLTAEAGQTWSLDVFSAQATGDTLSGMNFAEMKIEYYDAGGVLLSETAQTILDVNSPVDTWIDNAPLQVVAPAGTVRARAVFLFQQPDGASSGAALLDLASFQVVAGPQPVNPANFSLTAEVQGVANAAGEMLGAYQLRIEDPSGARLFFNGTANGSYQTIGGGLDTATEADANGTPASGVFNYNAASYRVVVAFGDSTTWGTGGTLNVDNLVLTNSDAGGSGWYAGLFWNGLTLTETDLSKISLTADVLGDVVGGEYELRLEALRNVDSGVNESFDMITQTGGGVFLGPESGESGGTNNWDDGIEGEAAFGGVFGGSFIFNAGPESGFSAQGVVDSERGNVGEIRAEDIVVAGTSGWFGGLTWTGQQLASTDLSQVVLTVDIKGIGAAGGSGPLGAYELRIEDAQGDRLYIDGTAPATWTSIGGPLNTFSEGGRLGGGGDGTFNLDSPNYTVVVSFYEPETTWQFGGTIRVDNVFLTPATNQVEIGRATFTGTANGAFQQVGGLLSTAATNLGDFGLDFNGVTGTGGGNLPPGTQFGWDDGIQNEAAFFGTFGDAVNNGGATVEGCTTCGEAATGAAVLEINDVVPNTGGWFAGIFVQNVPAYLNRDPNNIILNARLKAEADPNAGEMLGEIFVRIEDSDLTALSFIVPATGDWQTVGGALADANLEQIEPGDNIFNLNQATYTLTIGFVGTATNWGPGGKITLDNFFLSGTSLADADSFTVTLAFRNEIDTWGTNGSLAIDNLNFSVASCVGDINGDGNVGLGDLGIMFSNWNMAVPVNTNGDLTGDGFVNLSDLGILFADWGCTN